MNSESPIVFQKMREAGDVISDTLAFLRQHALPLGRSLLFIAGPLLLLSAAFGIWFQRQFLNALPDLSDPGMMEQVLEVFTRPAYYVAILNSFVAYFVLLGVSYAYLMNYVETGTASEPGAVWARFTHDLGPLLTTSLGLVLLVFMIGFVNIIPCLGQLAFLVGLVYLGVTLSTIYVVRLWEGIGFVEAISRCRSLVEGYWWPTLGLLVVTFIIYFVLSLILTIPTTILAFIIGFNSLSTGDLPLWFNAVSALFSVAGSFLIVIPITAVTLHYFNLLERKEAPGLMKRVERIGGTDPDAP